MLTSKKPVTAFQISKAHGIGSIRAAKSMCEKIRTALIEPQTMLGGLVEFDEMLSTTRTTRYRMSGISQVPRS